MGKIVMVTGASGYIGSWVVKELLEKGYTVRATVRDKNKTSKTKPLTDLAVGSAGKLELWEADLLKPGSFDEVAKGCESIMHVASPFTLRFKDAKKELIDPALEGTRNVLNAANRSGTVKKVVLTSSAAAVYGDAIDMKEKGLEKFTEEQFNETSSLDHQPYSYSKLLAEKEAWKIHDAQIQWKLVVINPTFVVGPSLTGASDSESINLMKNMLSGKFAMGAPELWFGFVDVRDVALAHVIALEDPDASGRHILAERSMNFIDLAQMLRSLYGNKYKLPKSSFPKFIFYVFGPFMGIKAKFISRNVGYPIAFDTSKSRTRLKLNYTPIEKSIGDMVEQMHRMNMVG
jgi:nucleoside-diphosphate-sugar epimerase